MCKIKIHYFKFEVKNVLENKISASFVYQHRYTKSRWASFKEFSPSYRRHKLAFGPASTPESHR